MNQPIYLNNLELALQMKKAGFDKECVHYASTVKHITGNATINVIAYDVVVAKLDNPENLVFKDLSLPTLQEIDLPHDVCVFQYETSFPEKKGTWFFARWIGFDWYIINGNSFTNKLEASAHAWLWANQKKEVQV